MCTRLDLSYQCDIENDPKCSSRFHLHCSRVEVTWSTCTKVTDNKNAHTWGLLFAWERGGKPPAGWQGLDGTHMSILSKPVTEIVDIYVAVFGLSFKTTEPWGNHITSQLSKTECKPLQQNRKLNFVLFWHTSKQLLDSEISYWLIIVAW